MYNVILTLVATSVLVAIVQKIVFQLGYEIIEFSDNMWFSDSLFEDQKCL